MTLFFFKLKYMPDPSHTVLYLHVRALTKKIGCNELGYNEQPSRFYGPFEFVITRFYNTDFLYSVNRTP